MSLTNGNCKLSVVNVARDLDDVQLKWLNEEEQSNYSYNRPNG